jgi:hypothetical protein
MKKQYTLPIFGTVVKKEPLTGDPNDPIVVFPIKALPDFPKHNKEDSAELIDYGYSYHVISFDVDNDTCIIELDAPEEVHSWLESKKALTEQARVASGLTLKRNDKK